MIIKEFKTFKEKYQKINEGGGAGKDFKFSCIEGNLDLKITKDGVEVIKNEAKGCGELDIVGYMGGIQNLDPNKLFEMKMEYLLKEDKLKKMTFGEIKDRIGEDIYENVENEKTVGQYLEEGNELILNIEVGGSEYHHMFGAGFMLSIMKKGHDIEFDIFDMEGGDGFASIYMDGEYNEDGLLHNILETTLVLTANENMEKVYKEVFVEDMSYEEYLKNVEEGEEPMDEELFYETRFEHIKDEYGWTD